MSDLKHLAVYMDANLKSDFDKFAALKRVTSSELGRQVIICWIEKQKEGLMENGFDFEMISDSLDNVKEFFDED